MITSRPRDTLKRRDKIDIAPHYRQAFEPVYYCVTDTALTILFMQINKHGNADIHCQIRFVYIISYFFANLVANSGYYRTFPVQIFFKLLSL